MGLAEQRQVKEHQEKIIPTVQRQIEQACGVAIHWGGKADHGFSFSTAKVREVVESGL